MKKALLLLTTIILLLTIMVSCNQEPPHEHSYSTEWSSDENYHWHTATCEHDVVDGKAAHTWVEDRVTKEATHTEAGEKVLKCSVCGLEKTETVPALVDAHTWVEDRVTKEATHTETGEKVFRCSVCGQEKTEAIPALVDAHAFADGWSSDENYHWHAATCEHNVIDGKATHTWVEDRVSKEATHTEAGEKVLKCSVCGLEKTEAIPALVNVHTFAEEWSYDEDYHWHEVTCDHDVYPTYEEHTWAEKTITKQPTYVDSGERTLYCTGCLLEKTEVIPALSGVHNNYHYNQLDSNQKTAYDAIVNNLSNYNSPVLITDYEENYSYSTVVAALDAVFRDRPDLFWSGQQDYHLGKQYWWQFRITFDHGITDVNQIESKKQIIAERLATIQEYVTATDDFGIAKMVYDYFVINTSYALNSGSDQTMYGIMGNSQGVCASYARAYQYVLQSYGIPCTFIDGTGLTNSGSQAHAWNAVMLGGSWYYVDVTWGHGYSSEGDSNTGDHYAGNGVDYTWFCRSSEFIDETHIPASNCSSPEAPNDHPSSTSLR